MATYMDGIIGSDDFRKEVELFLVNSPLDDNQKTYVVKLINDAYTLGYTDIIMAVKEEREKAEAGSKSFMDDFIDKLNDAKGDN